MIEPVKKIDDYFVYLIRHEEEHPDVIISEATPVIVVGLFDMHREKVSNLSESQKKQMNVADILTEELTKAGWSSEYLTVDRILRTP